MLMSEEKMLIGTLMCMFEGQKMSENCFESFNIEENLLLRKPCALENGSS